MATTAPPKFVIDTTVLIRPREWAAQMKEEYLSAQRDYDVATDPEDAYFYFGKMVGLEAALNTMGITLKKDDEEIDTDLVEQPNGTMNTKNVEI